MRRRIIVKFGFHVATVYGIVDAILIVTIVAHIDDLPVQLALKLRGTSPMDRLSLAPDVETRVEPATARGSSWTIR
jgi:hypothetical protein